MSRNEFLKPARLILRASCTKDLPPPLHTRSFFSTFLSYPFFPLPPSPAASASFSLLFILEEKKEKKKFETRRRLSDKGIKKRNN